MRCQEHDRDHCPKPRCHVLAVCLAEVPTACDRDSAASLAVWSRQYGYVWRPPNRCTYVDTRVKVADQIATRLVAWMRWRGSCTRCGEPGFYVAMDDRPRDEPWGWLCGCPEYKRPYWHHPLDALSPHDERVKALASECPNPTCTPSRLIRGRLHVNIEATRDNGGYPVPAPCDHDGINWATVAVLIDRMTELGISLDVVHEWRAPDDKPKGCLYHSCAVEDGEECALGKMAHLRHECPYWGKAL